MLGLLFEGKVIRCEFASTQSPREEGLGGFWAQGRQCLHRNWGWGCRKLPCLMWLLKIYLSPYSYPAICVDSSVIPHVYLRVGSERLEITALTCVIFFISGE